VTRLLGLPQIAWDRAGTDPGICAEMRLNQILAKQIPVYAYLFEDQTPPFYFPNMPGFTPLAYHTADIQFLFPLYHGGQGTAHPLTGEQATLSNQLVTAWTNFAWSGNPDGLGNAPWPVYSANAGKSDILVENVPSLSTETTAAFDSSHHCAFWASLTAK
jgi:para-nitrobenzyl esterase